MLHLVDTMSLIVTRIAFRRSIVNFVMQGYETLWFNAEKSDKLLACFAQADDSMVAS